MGIEVYKLSRPTLRVAKHIIAEYDLHEKAQTIREATICRGCLYYKTCQYSIYQTSAKERERHARDNDIETLYAGKSNSV